MTDTSNMTLPEREPTENTSCDVKHKKECPCKKAFQKVAQSVRPLMHKGVAWVKANQKIAAIVGGVLVLFVLFLLIPCGNKGSVAVLDLERVKVESAPYKTIADEQRKYEEIWKIKFQAEREVLDREDKELAARRNRMKAGEFKRAIDSLQHRAVALQEKYKGEAGKILAASQSVVAQVDAVAMETLERVAKAGGYDVVLVKQSTLYAGKAADITDDFIKELDKKSVKVSYPDPSTLTPQKQQ